MIVDQLRHRAVGSAVELSVRVRDDGAEPLHLWYRVPERHAPEGPPDASPFLPPLMLYAMARAKRLGLGRAELVFDPPVSARMLEAAEAVVRFARAAWPRQMGPLDVRAEGAVLGPGRPAAASFFTLGVDSWYSVLTHLDAAPGDGPPLAATVFVPQFLFTWPAEAVERQARATRQVTEELELEFIEPETNVVEAVRPEVPWLLLHGAMLAGVGLALGTAAVIVPATNQPAEPNLVGSHPELDPLFSSERTEIVHHAVLPRTEKLERLARSPLARATLSVCNKGVSDRNCGVCEKCLRTMLGLRVIGQPEWSDRFDAPLDPARVAAGTPRPPHRWINLREGLGDTELDRRLAAAIEVALLRTYLHTARAQARRARDGAEGGGLAPGLADAVRGAPRQIKGIQDAIVGEGEQPSGADRERT